MSAPHPYPPPSPHGAELHQQSLGIFACDQPSLQRASRKCGDADARQLTHARLQSARHGAAIARQLCEEVRHARGLARASTRQTLVAGSVIVDGRTKSGLDA